MILSAFSGLRSSVTIEGNVLLRHLEYGRLHIWWVLSGYLCLVHDLGVNLPLGAALLPSPDPPLCTCRLTSRPTVPTVSG